MDEDHFVGGGVAVQFGLRLGRAAAADRHVGVGQERDAAGDGVAGRAHRAGFEVVVAQHVLFDGFDGDRPGGLDLADARRRPQVVDDAVGPAEAGRGDDFFVVKALAAVAALPAVFDVAFAGDRTHLLVERHGVPPRRGRDRAERERIIPPFYYTQAPADSRQMLALPRALV